MNRIMVLLFCVFISATGICSMPSDRQLPTFNPILFDSIPSWIAQHTRFPEEADNYDHCGIERFTVSATWDGRIFISRPLNTLHPAYEQEIVRVVGAAPRCLTECRREDISKQIEIDFSKYLPLQQRRKMSSVAQYRPPKFSNTSEWDNGRGDFIQWIGSTYRIPQQWRGRAHVDTVTITYRIKPSGKVAEIVVSACRDASIEAEIKRTMTMAPLWEKPGVSDRQKTIDVVIRDTIVIGFDAEGRKVPIEICNRSEVFRNSSLPPSDPDMIVLVPESGPLYADEGAFGEALIKMLPEINEPIEIEGSFIIEKDGTTSGTDDDEVDDEIVKNVLQFIRESKWQPACQGGEPVRTLYAYSVLKPAVYPRAPKIALSQNQKQPLRPVTNSATFGKRYIDLRPKPGNYKNEASPSRDRNPTLEEYETNRLMYDNSR